MVGRSGGGSKVDSSGVAAGAGGDAVDKSSNLDCLSA